MSDGLTTEKAQRRAPPLMSCGRCGDIPAAVARLESQGNTFRMFRCAGCGDVTWQEFR